MTEIASVDFDLACPQCSYNLRGLSVASSCPECGTPIANSLLAVVQQLRGQARTLDWRALRKVSAAAIMLFVAGAIVTGVYFFPEPLVHSPGVSRRAALAAMGVAFSLQVAGAWQLSFADERIFRSRIRGRAFRITSAICWIYLATIILVMEWKGALELGDLLTPAQNQWVRLIAFVGGLALPLMQFLLWLAIQRIAQTARIRTVNVLSSIAVFIWPAIVLFVMLASALRAYNGLDSSLEIACWLPVTWIGLGPWFNDLPFDGLEQIGVTCGWIGITLIMGLAEGWLAVSTLRAARALNREAIPEKIAASSPT